MKSRTSCFNGKLFLNTLGRYSYLGVITLIIFFFAMPIFLLTELQYIVPGNTPYTLTMYYDINHSLHNGFAMLLGGISGLVLFSYLHQSRQVNFFHAQPVTRPVLLTHRLLVGPLLYAAAYLVNLLLVIIIVTVYGLAAWLPWLSLLAVFVQSLLSYVCIFLVTALAAQLTGSLFAHIEISLYLLLFPVGIPLTLQLLMRTYLSTYRPGPISELMLKISPLVALFTDSWGSLLYCVILVVLMTLLCFVLYNRRPLEQAGHAVAYRCFGSFVRISGGILCGLLMGLLFRVIGNSDSPLWLGLGMVLGILLWHMICQVQIHRTFRAALKGVRSLSAVLAVCIVVIMVMAAGCFGYDNLRYTSEQLSGIALDLNYKEYLGNHYSSEDTDVMLSDAESKDAVLDLIASMKHGAVMADKQPATQAFGTETAEVIEKLPVETSDAQYDEWISLECTYYPSFGLPNSHYYAGTFSSSEMDYLLNILSLPEYRRHHIIYDFTAASALEYTWEIESYSNHNPGDYSSYNLPNAKIAAFVEALQRDILERPIDPAEEEIAMVFIRGTDGGYGYFPFYASFTRTAELLKELDILQ